jgi:tRNA(adenine34) deaminase
MNPILSYAEKYMSEAIQLCGEAQKKEEVPIACVIVKDMLLFGKGFNQTLSQQKPLAHAEMIAIEAASKNIHN